MKKLCRQGEWNVTYRGTRTEVAQCLELEGFGIVGAVIDTEGNSIILERALAFNELYEVAEIVASLNTSVNMIGAGMLNNMVEKARAILNRLEAQ